MSTTNNRPKTRRHFDDAFKQDAVNRVIRTNKSCAEVSRELGIRGNLLARWKREQLDLADQAVTGADQMKPSELVAALEAARREADDLREQRDILKKALNIFSQQMPKGGRR